MAGKQSVAGHLLKKKKRERDPVRVTPHKLILVVSIVSRICFPTLLFEVLFPRRTVYVHVSLRNVYIDRKRESPVCISGKELSSIHLSFRSFSCRKPPSLSLAYNDCFLSQVSNASKRTVFGFALSRTHRACTWGLAPASAYFFRARSAKNRCRNTLALPSTCSNFFLLVFSSLLFLALIPCCRDVVTRFPFTLFFCFLSLPRCRFLDGRAFPATPVFLLAHFFFFLFLFGSPLASLPFGRSRPRKELKQ